MFGPPVKGAPWCPPFPAPPPAAIPGAVSPTARTPGAKRGDLPFVTPADDPGTPPRLRRHSQEVAEVINSLIRGGYLKKTGGEWVVTGTGATGGGGLTSLDATTPTTLTGILRGTGTVLSTVTIDSTLTFTAGTLSVTPGGTATDPKTSIYPAFTVAGVDDEFDDGVFSGWTAVHTTFLTPTETNNVLSVVHAGGAAAAELSAYVKAATVAVGDVIELAYRSMGESQINICGLVFADGSTYGAGDQVVFYWSPVEPKWYVVSYTGFNTAGAFNVSTGFPESPHSDMFLRLKMTAANTWHGYASPDGVSWVDVTGAFSRTLAPTHVGFFFTTWTGAAPAVFSLRYFRLRT